MRSIVFVLSAIVSLCGSAAQAQTYPNKPIKVIVPHSVGGSPDTFARIVAQKVSESLGQQVVVETRLGAGGIVGSNVVIQSAPDGYTLLMADSSAYAITPHMYASVPFDPLKSLVPIMPGATVPLLLVVHPALKVSNLKELVALAKTKPGIFYGSSGSGTPHHLAMELLKSRAGIDLAHVAYKGSAQSVLGLIASEVSVAFMGTNAASPQAKAGKLKIIAVSTASRIPLMPEIATVAEAGFPGFEVNTTFGFFAPLSTPRDIVGKLNAELSKAVKSGEVQQRLYALGLEAAADMTPEQYAEFVRKEYQTFGALVKAIGARAD